MAATTPAYSICVLCSGNICRSPIGEVVLRDALDQAGLADRVRVTSAGTGDWHQGQSADHRAEAVVREHGLDLSTHTAEVLTDDGAAELDLVLAMDSGHQAWMESMHPQTQVRLIRSFDPASVADDDLDVADPYYGDRRDFDIAMEQVQAAMPGVVEYVRSHVASDG